MARARRPRDGRRGVERRLRAQRSACCSRAARSRKSNERGEPITGDTLLVLLNGHHDKVPFTLPRDSTPSSSGSASSTRSIRTAPTRMYKAGARYPLQGRSVAVLQDPVAAAASGGGCRRDVATRRRIAGDRVPSVGAASAIGSRDVDADQRSRRSDASMRRARRARDRRRHGRRSPGRGDARLATARFRRAARARHRRAHPAGDRRRPLSDQAHRRRDGRRHGRHLRRRPRRRRRRSLRDRRASGFGTRDSGFAARTPAESANPEASRSDVRASGARRR